MPRWLRVAIHGLVGLVLGAVLGVVASAFYVRHAFDAVESVDPSEKARFLGESISRAMNFGVAMAPVGLVLGLVVGARRSRPAG